MQRIRKPLVVLLSLVLCAAFLTACGNDVASTPKVTVEEPSFTAVLPKGYELQEESLNFLDASIPCKLYYYTGENDIFMLMYADYGAMFESLSTETGMDLGQYPKGASDSTISGAIAGTGLFTIGDKSAGKIGNVDAAVYPISKIQDTVAKGYVGGFLDEKGRMILMAYAAAPSAYSEKDYQEYFEGFHWNEAQ